MAIASLVLGLGLCALTGAHLFADAVPGQYVLIGAPLGGFSDTADIVARAEGAILATGGFSNILVVASTESDFKSRLQAQGAWMVLPSPRILGCGPALAEEPQV